MKALLAKMAPLDKVVAPLWAVQCVCGEDEGGRQERMKGVERERGKDGGTRGVGSVVVIVGCQRGRGEFY